MYENNFLIQTYLRVEKMLQKLLNRLGIYTKRQYLEMKFYCDALEARFEHLASVFSVSEEVKSEAIEENRKLKKELEELKLRLTKSVKRGRR